MEVVAIKSTNRWRLWRRCAEADSHRVHSGLVICLQSTIEEFLADFPKDLGLPLRGVLANTLEPAMHTRSAG